MDGDRRASEPHTSGQVADLTRSVRNGRGEAMGRKIRLDYPGPRAAGIVAEMVLTLRAKCGVYEYCPLREPGWRAAKFVVGCSRVL